MWEDEEKREVKNFVSSTLIQPLISLLQLAHSQKELSWKISDNGYYIQCNK